MLLPCPISADEDPLYPTAILLVVSELSEQSRANVRPDPAGTVRLVVTVDAPEATEKVCVMVEISDAETVKVQVSISELVNVLAWETSERGMAFAEPDALGSGFCITKLTLTPSFPPPTPLPLPQRVETNAERTSKIERLKSVCRLVIIIHPTPPFSLSHYNFL